MRRILAHIFASGAVIAVASACDPGAIPNRNVNDVTHEVQDIDETIRQLVVHNPNATRVGAQFHIRVFAPDERPPVADYLAHVYVPPQMAATERIDVSAWCRSAEEEAAAEAASEPAPPCAELRADAVLLQTYWMADE